MDAIMEIIKKRISIRAYKDSPLSKDIIDSLLEAAKHAPSARNLQELEYKVITSKELIKKLSDAIKAIVTRENPSMPARPSFFYNAPLLIIITAPADNLWAPTDAGLAAQNIMLYAASLELGTCFIGMAKFIEREKALMEELHIKEGYKIVGAVVCGYPDETPVPKEKRLKAEFFS